MLGTTSGGRYVITGVRKEPRQDPYRRISMIRYRDMYSPVGAPPVFNSERIVPIDSVIAMIEGGAVFYSRRPGLLGRADIESAVLVYVRQSPSGNKFLTTNADGSECNNLLSQPAI